MPANDKTNNHIFCRFYIHVLYKHTAKNLENFHVKFIFQKVNGILDKVNNSKMVLTYSSRNTIF